MNEHGPTGPKNDASTITEKRCPYRKDYKLSDMIAAQTRDEVRQDQFAPCLLDKCAMCRSTEITVAGERKGVYYCGLAGKP